MEIAVKPRRWIAAVLLVLPMISARAEDKPWSANFSLVSEYRFRGIAQNWGRPALQGGAEYAFATGWYVGAWSSQVSDNVYPGARYELDLYGGYRSSFANGLGVNAGVLHYGYPGSRYRPAPGVAAQRFSTIEAFLDLAYRDIGVKYSRTLGDYFGVNADSARSPAFCADSSPASPCNPGVPTLPASGGSRGSGYLELYGNVELARGATLKLHAGSQQVRNYNALGFRDYRVGLGKDLSGFAIEIAYTYNSGDRGLYHYADNAGQNLRQLAGHAWLLAVSKSF
jgi:hypothetical protein